MFPSGRTFREEAVNHGSGDRGMGEGAPWRRGLQQPASEVGHSSPNPASAGKLGFLKLTASKG